MPVKAPAVVTESEEIATGWQSVQRWAGFGRLFLGRRAFDGKGWNTGRALHTSW
jgi:hypothetical protein